MALASAKIASFFYTYSHNNRPFSGQHIFGFEFKFGFFYCYTRLNYLLFEFFPKTFFHLRSLPVQKVKNLIALP